MSVHDYLEFKHLKSIVAIAEEGTITAAATRLPLAQSALSRQINELEEAVHVQIFERDHGGISLTPAGESLLHFARELLETRIHVVKAVQAIHQATLRPFRLGFTPFIERQVISTVCEAYRDLFPKGSLHPENGDTEDIIKRLRIGELDAVLVTLPVLPDGYSIQPLIREPLVVCIRKDDPLADYDKLPTARVLRTMRGGTQSRLALCDDGIQYVIKCPNNPQGPNVLANEFIAAKLMSAVGLPIPPSRAVRYDIDNKCMFELDHRNVSEESACDLHFASELIMPTPGDRLYSYLPSSFIPRIENRSMFLGALVFDIWAGSTDARQAIYIENRDKRSFRAMFIDNGHLFGGPDWHFSLRAGIAICLERDVYVDLLDLETIETWIFQIGTKVNELLPDLIKIVPPQWYKGDIGGLQKILLARAGSLRRLFWDEIANLQEPLRSSFRGIYETSYDAPVLPR